MKKYVRSGVVQTAEAANKQRRRIRRQFSASLLSDTKWRKLIAALDRPDLSIGQAVVKLVGDDVEHTILMPKSGTLHPPRPYIDIFEFGPIPLRSIEWLELPAIAEYPRHAPNGSGKASPLNARQDLRKAKIALQGVGKFVIEETDRGLRIIGHR